jgi:hypothetical protein
MPNTIDWGDNEVKLLINERRNRNEEYWFMLRRSKLPFWKDVAEKIKEEFNTDVTAVQCQAKFKGIVKDCKVSKILIKKANDLIV